MSTPRNLIASEYMQWAKTRSQARFNLATSGLMNYSLGELGVTLDDIELSGPSWYGYQPLQEALAAKCGVPPECVVASIGTSLANHLAMAAMVNPGDEVLIEQPAYEPILALAEYLGATVRRFRRRFENAFRIEVDEVRRHTSGKTRLIVITNLHNPSSAPADTATLRSLGDLARAAGARVLVDEVYLELVTMRPGNRPGKGVDSRSAFHLGREFVATGSLTKAYGLSGLRCGWILAEPELARRIWLLNDLFEVIPAHPAERLSVLALERLGQVAARAAALLRTNRAILNRFLDSRDDLDVVKPEDGTVVFPRLRSGQVDRLCSLLRDKYETTVVPGRFFEMPDHFRIGIGDRTETLSAGLDRLGSALDEILKLRK